MNNLNCSFAQLLSCTLIKQKSKQRNFYIYVSQMNNIQNNIFKQFPIASR